MYLRWRSRRECPRRLWSPSEKGWQPISPKKAKRERKARKRRSDIMLIV